MNIPDISTFKKYKEKETVTTESGELLPGVSAQFFSRIINEKEESIGIFSLGEKTLYCAWGWRKEPLCSAHAVSDGKGGWLTPLPGCPQITVQKENGQTVSFNIKNGEGSVTHFNLLTDSKKCCHADKKPSSQLFIKLKLYRPLIIMWALVIAAVIFKQIISSYSFTDVLQTTMIAYFMLFGLLKIVNLKAFVQSYSQYDILAKKYLWTAYAYPFFELMFAVIYIVVPYHSLFITITNWTVFILMSTKALGVYKSLQKKDLIKCACLGGFFAIPISYITLGEDILMAFMALTMIFI